MTKNVQMSKTWGRSNEKNENEIQSRTEELGKKWTAHLSCHVHQIWQFEASSLSVFKEIQQTS